MYHPCLDTFMRALPFTFRSVEAGAGTVVAVVVSGEAGGRWAVERRDGGWVQVPEPPRAATSTVTLTPDTAWKVVTKRWGRAAVQAGFPDIRIDGDQALGRHVLDMVSVMA